LQEHSEDVRVSLVHLIKENHGVGTLTKTRGELTSLIIADIARRSTNQLGHLQEWEELLKKPTAKLHLL
jgi:hypothetical protein